MFSWHIQWKENEEAEPQTGEFSVFGTGISAIEGWSGACWIGAGKVYREGCSVLLRKEFRLPGQPDRVRCYATGLGYHELLVNGTRVGDAVLDPPQTDYGQRVFYGVHDLSDLMRTGTNVVGLHLADGFYHQFRHRDSGGMVDGHGMYGDPCAILLLEAEYSDGRVVRCLTGENGWTCATGPVLQNNIFAGETHDARLEQKDWAHPDFAGKNWEPAAAASPPGGVLRSSPIEPMRICKELSPRALTQPRMGTWIYDFGENLSGWVRLRPIGPAGSELTMRFAEVLDEQGLLDTDSGGTFHTGLIQTDRYITAGSAEEVYQIRFTSHGFRYVELTNCIEPPDTTTLTALKVHNDLRTTGYFECENELLNTLHDMVKRTITSNLQGIPTDCPIRERCGWTGDAWLICDSLMYLFDASALLKKFVGDIRTSRMAYGQWMHVVPGRRTCLEAGPLWTLAQVLIPWQIFQFTGGGDYLHEVLPDVKDWVGYYGSRMKEGAPLPFPLVGDHAAPIHVPTVADNREAFAWAGLFHGLNIASKIAQSTGHLDFQQKTEERIKQVRDYLLSSNYNAQKATFGSQALDAFSLKAGFAPEQDRRRVADSIAQSILEHDGHLIAGAVGMRYLFQVLTEFGHARLLGECLAKDSYPGLRQQILRGATTLWETWESDSSQNDSSRNHPFKGGFGSWFYSHILGIKPTSPGFVTFQVKPACWELTNRARGSFISPLGPISVAWERTVEGISLEVEVPPGAVAAIECQGLHHAAGTGIHSFQFPSTNGGAHEWVHAPMGAGAA